MKIALYIISGICWLQFVSVALASKSAIHEIEYILFALVAIIAMSAGYIINLLEPAKAKTTTKPEPKPLSDKKGFWKKPGQLD